MGARAREKALLEIVQRQRDLVAEQQKMLEIQVTRLNARDKTIAELQVLVEEEKAGEPTVEGSTETPVWAGPDRNDMWVLVVGRSKHNGMVTVSLTTPTDRVVTRTDTDNYDNELIIPFNDFVTIRETDVVAALSLIQVALDGGDAPGVLDLPDEIQKMVDLYMGRGGD